MIGAERAPARSSCSCYFGNLADPAITQVLQWIARSLDKLDMYVSELRTNGDPPWTCNWKAWKNDKPQETKSIG